MGFKASCILINQNIGEKKEQLLSELNLNLESTNGKETFELVRNPELGYFYIGTYEGNTIISCDIEILDNFYSESLSDFEQVFIKYFPKATIIALSLQSVVNHYGFAIIENGTKVRIKVGDFEEPVRIDFGTITPEESKIQQNATIDKDGNLIFKYTTSPEETYTEDAAGEEYIFEISERILGMSIDDDRLFDIELEEYKIKRSWFKSLMQRKK